MAKNNFEEFERKKESKIMTESILNPWAVDCIDKFLYFFCPEPGDLFKGIANCLGAARSVIQVYGCGPHTLAKTEIIYS